MIAKSFYDNIFIVKYCSACALIEFMSYSYLGMSKKKVYDRKMFLKVYLTVDGDAKYGNKEYEWRMHERKEKQDEDIEER